MPSLQRTRFCLIIEEDPKAGLDLADALDPHSFFVAGPLTSGQAALDWLGRFTPDVAVIDPVLRDGAYPDLLNRLHDLGVPVIIYSAKGVSEGLLPFVNEIWIQRACGAADLVNMLLGLFS